MKNGSRGAASGVRRIDPATYQPPQPRPHLRPIAKPPKHKGLMSTADSILVEDAKRRHGKRYSQLVRDKIVRGRYR